MRHIDLSGLALAALLFANSADAAILWFGGEDIDLTSTGAGITYLTNSTYDTNFARAGFGVQNSTTVADPMGSRWIEPTFSAASDIWVHATFQTATSTTTSNEQALLIRSPDGVSRIILRQTGTAGQLKISTRNSAGTITDLVTSSSGAWTTTTPTTLDLHVNYTCSGSGGVDLYIATVLVATYTGNPCTDAATTLYQVELGSVSNGNNSGNACTWSELIIADENSVSMRLSTLTLSAAGNTQGWTPSTLGNVNKATIADGTSISDPTGNVLSQWKVQTAAPSGTWGVKSVSIEARLLKSTTGPTQFDWSWRISGSDYLAGLTNALTNSFVNYRLQRDTSPATSSTWAQSEVYNTSTNTMNIGIKSLP